MLQKIVMFLWVPFTVLASGPPVDAPYDFHVVQTSPHSIAMQWSGSVSGKPSGWNIERIAQGQTNWTLVANLPKDLHVFADSPLMASTGYMYRIRAFKGASGVSSWVTNPGGFIITPPDNMPPIPPQPIPPQAQDFTISASPSGNSTTQGYGVSYQVVVQPLNGFQGTVNLSVGGIPYPVSYSFSPPTLGAGGQSTLTVGTSTSTAPGYYTLSIIGSSGNVSHTFNVSLQVLYQNPPPPQGDFSLTVTPPTFSTKVGQNAAFNVAVGMINGYTGPVNLSASGLPSSFPAVSFNPVTVYPNGSSSLVIATGNAPGSYLVTVTGSSGSHTHSASVSLTVN